jgi:hypothetical protein
MDGMAKQPDFPVWNFVFNERPPYRLERTEFLLMSGASPQVAIRGPHFVWRAGIPALAMFYVELKREFRRRNAEGFVFQGPLGSPAASLEMALGQAEKNTETPPFKWPWNLCGRRDRGSAVLVELIEHHHRDKGSDRESFICMPRLPQLPPENVGIFRGHQAFVERRELTELEDLQAVDDDLCKHWEGEQNLALPAPAEAPSSSLALPGPFDSSVFMFSKDVKGFEKYSMWIGAGQRMGDGAYQRIYNLLGSLQAGGEKFVINPFGSENPGALSWWIKKLAQQPKKADSGANIGDCKSMPQGVGLWVSKSFKKMDTGILQALQHQVWMHSGSLPVFGPRISRSSG